jgi:hypothetical protein
MKEVNGKIDQIKMTQNNQSKSNRKMRNKLKTIETNILQSSTDIGQIKKSLTEDGKKLDELDIRLTKLEKHIKNMKKNQPEDGLKVKTEKETSEPNPNERQEEGRKNDNPEDGEPPKEPPGKGPSELPDPSIEEKDQKLYRKNKWEENLKMLRRCEESRGPSEGIDIPEKQLSECISQFTDILLRIRRVNAANMGEECKKLKETFDHWTNGKFTWIADTARRGHVNELLTNRMEITKHLPHPFHCQCHIRGCGFGSEIPEELDEHLKTEPGYSDNQIINEEMNAIVQIYGDELG